MECNYKYWEMAKKREREIEGRKEEDPKKGRLKWLCLEGGINGPFKVGFVHRKGNCKIYSLGCT